MTDGQISLTVSLVMIALFTVAILSFAIGFASDNDAAVSVLDDPSMSSLAGETTNSISGFRADSEDTYSSIVSTTVEPGSDVVRSSGSFTITWSNVFGVTKNILNVAYEKVFGKGAGFGIFITTFVAIIGFIFALYLIKTWRGNP